MNITPHIVLLLATFGLDVLPTVHDQAGLYKDATIEEANRKLEAIRKAHEVDVRVETLRELPADELQRYERAAGTAEKETVIARFARRKARESGVDGLYALIVQKPVPRINLVLWPEPRHDLLTSDNLKKLRLDLTKQDRGLLAFADRLGPMLQSRAAARNTSQIGWTAVMVVASLFGVWVLLGLVRRKMQAARASEANPEAAKPTFVAGLLGGLFGNAAGLWIHDRLFQARPEPGLAPLADFPPADPPPPADAVATNDAHSDPSEPTEPTEPVS